MRKLFLLLLLTVCCQAAFAQQSNRISIRGSITDTSKAVMPGATVMLLTPKDSALVNFGRTNDKGVFEFRNVKRAPYILKVSYVGFLPLQVEVNPDNSDAVDLGALLIKPIQKELLEVVVKTARAPLTIRGDTIEYNASSFKVPPGSTVEELLRKLPGVQVDQEGNIKAQGEDVKKVTVDGKTFFGSDPKLATKNLPADAIDKIQIFNDKTEAAKTTGIDDGKREKAVNLELKESHRKGGFGKVTAGVGTEERFQLRGNYNRFNTKEQMSVLGFGNNINQTGLSWDDYQDFRGSQSFNWEDQGDFGFYSGGNIFFGGDDNMGVPITGGGSGNRGFSRNYAGGANYNYDTKKTKLSSNYFYNQSGQTLNSNLQKQTFIPGGDDFLTLEGKSSGSFARNHRGSARFEKNLDSLNTLVVIGNLRANNGSNTQFSDQMFYRTGDTSQTSFNNRSNFSGFQLATTAIFRHKFRKKGRNFAASAAFNLNDSDGSVDQRSTNTYFNDTTGTGPTVIRINQDNTTTSLRTEFKSSLHYTEPLTKTLFLEGFYNFSIRNDKVDRDVFDVTDQGQIRNTGLSRYYTNDFVYNRVGSMLRYSDKGFNVSGGLAGVWFDLAGRFAGDQNSPTFTNVNRNYFSVIPNFSGNYRLKNKSVNLSYNVQVNQPQTSDLQPGVVDNSNPRFIREGNPNLLPALTHQISTYFSSFNPGSFFNYYINLNYGYNINQIVYNQTISQELVTTTRPENITGGTRFGSYLGMGFPLKKTKATLNFSGNLNFSKNITLINTIRNNTNSNNYNLRVNLDLTLSDRFTFYPNFNWNFTDTRYSINTGQNQKIYNYSWGGNMNIMLPAKIYFNGNLNYQTYQIKNDLFPFTQRLPIMNLALYKQFLKDNKAEVRITAYDVFNKNRGISQQANQNFVQKEQVQTLAQYFMLSFSYNLRGLKSQMRQNNYF
jgi:hypothetical protein